MRTLVIGLLVIAGSVSAQKPPSAVTSTKQDTESVRPLTKIFRSETLHFAYVYPETYVDVTTKAASEIQSGSARAAVNPEDKKAAECVTIPFAAMDPRSGMVLILRADSHCLKSQFSAESMALFATQVAQGAMKTEPTAKFSEPKSYKILEHPAALILGTVETRGTIVHTAFACVLTAPDVVCWQFISPSLKVIEELGNQNVQFDDTGVKTEVVIASNLLKPAAE